MNLQDVTIQTPKFINEIAPTPITTVEALEELSEDEKRERYDLELLVERAFYEAGVALRELRDKRLYRSTHRTFEEYYRERFGFRRSHSYQMIDAAGVVENLSAIGGQILPTNERQVRPLTRLEPAQQLAVWREAVEQAGGRLPSGRIVKNIVERLQERGATPLPILFQAGDVVLISGAGNPDLRKYHGQWTIALRIDEYTVTIALDGKEVSVKPQFLEPVDPQYWAEVKAINERITRLQLECDLDPAEDAVLEVLRRRTCFTPKQMMLLARIEQDYAQF